MHYARFVTNLTVPNVLYAKMELIYLILMGNAIYALAIASYALTTGLVSSLGLVIYK
jgi:hypothetical protein